LTIFLHFGAEKG